MQYWRTKLSLRSVLCGPPKGRSVKALRERCDALIKDPITRSRGVTLTKYLDKVKVATKWRTGIAVLSMEDAQLEMELAVFEVEGTV